MAVPDFQSFFRPLLEYASDGKDHSMREAREAVAASMGVSAEDRRERLPSGTQEKFDNRIAWAKSYLKQAGCLSFPTRGEFRITERGARLLSETKGRIDVASLKQFPEFLAFHTAKGSGSESGKDSQKDVQETPEESLLEAYKRIREALASELLTKITSNTPRFFENLVVDLMLALGYGGSRVEAGQSIGQTGDEGIDGIIKEDRLGLDIIYLQAKRWEGTVGRPDVQKFVGALHGKRAKKGVFITTGKFSDDAVKYVETIDPKVILIDGSNLVNLMIDHDLGVSLKASYDVKRADNDYFGED